MKAENILTVKIYGLSSKEVFCDTKGWKRLGLGN